jgi:hypothetical protein
MTPDGEPLFTCRRSRRNISMLRPDRSPGGLVQEHLGKVRAEGFVQYGLLSEDSEPVGTIEFRIDTERPESLSLLFDTSDLHIRDPNGATVGRVFRFTGHTVASSSERRELHFTAPRWRRVGRPLRCR